MYLAWFDADRKKPVTEKIAEARERYLAKFGAEPAVCLVNPADAVPGTPVELRPAAYISRNCFWIGVDEREAPLPAPLEEPAGPVAPSAVPAAAPAEIAQPGAPAPTPKPKKSPKAAKPVSVLATEPTGPGVRSARSASRVAARQPATQDAQVAATLPVTPTVLAPKSRKRATAETKAPTTPAVPTGDDGKSTTTVPAAGRPVRQAPVPAATATPNTRTTGRKPARATEPTISAVPAESKASKGKRQTTPSVIDSRKDAPPAKSGAGGKATNPAPKAQPTQVARAPKSAPAKPRKVSEAAKPATTSRPRRERPAA